MRKIVTSIYVLAILLLAACQNDKPEPPKTNQHFLFLQSKKVEASSLKEKSQEGDPFFVKHHINGSDVFIECIVKGASFRDKQAKISVYIDGKKHDEVTNAAFILKGLEDGQHHIRLVLKTNQQSIQEEFTVQIR